MNSLTPTPALLAARRAIQKLSTPALLLIQRDVERMAPGGNLSKVIHTGTGASYGMIVKEISRRDDKNAAEPSIG